MISGGFVVVLGNREVKPGIKAGKKREPTMVDERLNGTQSKSTYIMPVRTHATARPCICRGLPSVR